jgi:hypothetical protein
VFIIDPHVIKNAQNRDNIKRAVGERQSFAQVGAHEVGERCVGHCLFDCDRRDIDGGNERRRELRRYDEAPARATTQVKPSAVGLRLKTAQKSGYQIAPGPLPPVGVMSPSDKMVGIAFHQPSLD